MLSYNDKIGGRPLSPFQLIPQLLSASNAQDIPSIQASFSWKKVIHNYSNYERLERAIVGMTLIPEYFSALSINLWGVYSIR